MILKKIEKIENVINCLLLFFKLEIRILYLKPRELMQFKEIHI